MTKAHKDKKCTLCAYVFIISLCAYVLMSKKHVLLSLK